jgi:hypothetical protein
MSTKSADDIVNKIKVNLFVDKSTVCLQVNSLFTTQLFVYKSAFCLQVNCLFTSQLFVYNSTVCLQVSCLFTTLTLCLQVSCLFTYFVQLNFSIIALLHHLHSFSQKL